MATPPSLMCSAPTSPTLMPQREGLRKSSTAALALRHCLPPRAGGRLPNKPSINREDAMQTLPQIDQVLRKGIDAGDVPGVVAMAATRDGPVYEGAFGKRALPEGPAMTADSVFWIASMTKAITTTAAMQLVERGKLALDSPI